ncbi:MAG: hypothetical protein AABW75_04950 [Nanoarchaeota archaeon]
MDNINKNPKIIIERKLKELISFTRENKISSILFILATFFFIYQHFTYLSWDFSAYVLNARHLFSDGTYFETQRPPLASLIMGIFIFLGKFTEYLYILIVSSLFFYSSIKSSDILLKNIRKEEDKGFARFIFYFFSLGIFTLLLGLKEGTELLTLALLELFIVQIIKGKVAGVYLGLAVLSRYQMIIFAPLLILDKDYKKIIKNIFLFVIIIFPWFLWNFITYGNWFTSFIDGYAQNVVLRESQFMPFAISDVIKVGGIYFIPFLFGIGISIIKITKKAMNWFEENKTFILMFIITTLFIYSYYMIPFKFARYLFNLTLPIAFFSSFFIITLINKVEKLNHHKNKFYFILFFIAIVTIVGATKTTYFEQNSMDKFYNAAQDIKKLNIENCEILSPHWVPVTYFTENVYPPKENKIEDVINNKKIILLFNEKTIDDTFIEEDIKKLIVLHQTNDYIFYYYNNSTKDCSLKKVFSLPLISNHCQFISQKFIKLKLKNLTQKVCEIVNTQP